MDLQGGRRGTRRKGELSFRERSAKTRRNRVRQRLVLLSTAAVLMIVLIILVIKMASLGEAPDQKGKPDTNKTKQAEKEIVPTATPQITATPEPAGAAKWLRTDLDPNKPMVALTFDDGPYTTVTKRILKSLQAHGGRATFFVVGNRVERYAATLKQAYEQGNQIGSHTFDHADLSRMKPKKIKSEIRKTNQAVAKVIGCDTTALRPPYGNVNQKMRKSVGVPMYYWSVDSEDWKSRNTKKIIKQCKSIRDGDIVLMHDLYPTTAAAVEKLIPSLVKKGIQLVTLDELCYYKKLNVKPGKVYYSGR